MGLDRGLLALAHHGPDAYRDRYELVFRRESVHPNDIWQADHTQLDVMVVNEKGGYCLQGCKVNAKASPYVTHLPDALAHAVEIRANCMATRIELDQATGRAVGVIYHDEVGGAEILQRAQFVAVAGYFIETPRLLLNSTSARFPHGLCNTEDQVGRYVMVQGASQTAGRFPDELRMYKAPPPEVSSEQFYETDPARGFRRGFSIQTVSPLPIGWAEHVLADGHWGRAMREYMRDYNHSATIGVLNELLPQPDNRITIADQTDPYGIPIARMDYTLCDNDKANIDYSTKTITKILHAADSKDVLTIHRYAHLVGGARMGTNPESSVIDANQRSWAVPNLFLAVLTVVDPVVDGVVVGIVGVVDVLGVGMPRPVGPGGALVGWLMWWSVR